MTRTTLLLFVFILIYISAESQNKEVISDRTAVITDENLNRNNTNAVRITHISVLRSDSKSFIPQEKQAIVNNVSDNTSMKKAKTHVILSSAPMTAERVSSNTTINRQAIAVDKTQQNSDKKRVTITNLSATQIEN